MTQNIVLHSYNGEVVHVQKEVKIPSKDILVRPDLVIFKGNYYLTTGTVSFGDDQNHNYKQVSSLKIGEE